MLFLNKTEQSKLIRLKRSASVCVIFKATGIKAADRESAVVVWDRNDCLTEAKKQLIDQSNYLEIKTIEKT